LALEKNKVLWNLDNDKNAEHVLAGWLVAGGGAF